MSDAEVLSRKKRVRAAHRASAKRMITQARDLLETRADGAGVPNAQRLRQSRQALQAKVDLLAKLDEEIVGLVGDDDLEEEIDQADRYREDIELAIIEIDSVTDDNGTDASHRSATPSESRDTDPGENSPEPELPPDPPGHGATSALADPLSTSPSRHLATTEPRNVPHVKLPKLSLKKFDGDLTKWTTFWDTFEAAIHNSSTLTSIDKFNYLNSLLESAAADAVSGLTLTAANYEEAIATLKRRFGNKQLIINRHMDLLLNLDAVTSQHNLKALRHLYDVVEANVRGLRALGVPSES